MYISLDTVKSWPKPNYIDPEERGPFIVILNIVLYIVVFVVVGLRTYTRLVISRGFGADDFLILVALLITTAFVTVTLLAETKYGWSRHSWDVPIPQVSMGLRLSLATQILFAVASSVIRLSMLLLTSRILSTAKSTLQKVINWLIVMMAIDIVIFIIVEICQCRPISAYWTLSLIPQRCIDSQMHLLIQGCLNVIYDFLCVLIPIPVVLKLQLALRQRIMVAALFAAGFLACIAGIVRTYYMYKVTSRGERDVTWDAFPVWLATAVELYVGIVCSSIPPTRPFFARYLPKLLSATSILPSGRNTEGQKGSIPTWNSNGANQSAVGSSSRGPRGNSMDMELLGADKEGKKEIDKTVEVEVGISQSWLDLQRSRASSSTESMGQISR